MIYLLLIAIALDVVTTLCVLRIGGRELNPIMRALFGAVGPAPAMLATHVGLGAVIWLDRASMSPTLVAVVAGFWWALVVWNLAQIWRQRRNWR